MAWTEENGSVEPAKIVKINGTETAVSNAQDLINKIVEKSRELELKDFIVLNSSGLEIEKDELAEKYSELDSIIIAGFNEPSQE